MWIEELRKETPRLLNQYIVGAPVELIALEILAPLPVTVQGS